MLRACRPCEFTALPEELQRELNDTCCSSASNGAEASGTGGGVRVAEIHLIQGVEKLCPELQAVTLGECEILQK